jgi:hypothetical protein
MLKQRGPVKTKWKRDDNKKSDLKGMRYCGAKMN